MVFFVEDNSDAQRLIRRAALKALAKNVEITFAVDGQEALSILETCDVPQLIVLDIKLPKVSGMELLQSLRSSGRFLHCPIVIMSASENPADVEQAYALGATNYLPKPSDFYDYLDVVECMLKHWVGHRIQPAGQGVRS